MLHRAFGDWLSNTPIIMGSGVSKNSRNLNVVPRQPQMDMAVDRPPTSDLKPKVVQHRPVQDRGYTSSVNKEHTNEEQSERISLDEWEVLLKYTHSFPELQDDLQTMLTPLQDLRKAVDDKSKGYIIQYSKLSEIFEELFNTSCSACMSAGSNDSEKYNTLMEFIIEVEGATVLHSFVKNCFTDYYTDGRDDELGTSDQEETFTSFGSLLIALGTIQNFADFHDGFCLASAQDGVVLTCMENIKRIDQENDDWQSEDEESETFLILDACTGILHNISRRLRDRQWFANSDETLVYFAKVKVAGIAAPALLCLAYLVNEETNHLISADKDLLRFIIRMLDEAWKEEDRRSNAEFSAKELAEGLSHLAINDNNKQILGSEGAIRVLTSTLQTSSDDEERASAAKALWMLAFDDSNKDIIREGDGTVDILRTLHHNQNAEVQKAAAGALWEIEGKTARDKAEKMKEGSGNHVMISYQWDAQEVLVQVKNQLQANGYRVWMDLEQMGGSTLDAMAKAVENAAVVLICVSQRYKESPNCRSEAEYAYQLRKDIIPLMMQKNYKADGWLGMLLGTKMWIDFQSKHTIDSGVAKLVRELAGRGKDVDHTDGPPEAVIRTTEVTTLTKQPSGPDVAGWTNEDVKKWLKKIGLAQVCDRDMVEFTGQTLIELQDLRGECPDYFYKCLEHTLQLKNMFHVLKFRKELDKLLGN